MLTVTRQFVRPKSPAAAPCEDMIGDGRDWAVLCDGATDPTGASVDGHTNGQAVAELICQTVAAAPSGIPANQLLADINTAYEQRFRTTVVAGDPRGRAYASFVAVDKPARRIVRVGDTGWRTEHRAHPPTHKRIDTITSQYRAAVVRMHLAAGARAMDLRIADPGREAITPGLRMQPALINNPDAGDLAFAAINGLPVPDQFVEEWTLGSYERTVVLASDGYPRLDLTLEACEEYLHRDLVADPLRIGQHAGTKAVTWGAESYDDRAYLRLDDQPEP